MRSSHILLSSKPEILIHNLVLASVLLQSSNRESLFNFSLSVIRFFREDSGFPVNCMRFFVCKSGDGRKFGVASVGVTLVLS